MIQLTVSQGDDCPLLGAAVTVNGIARIWADFDCQSGMTIGDAQKIARSLIQLEIVQAADCPRPGDNVQAS
ncbi:MAG: hypothetical protein Q7T33_00155 [Dehalococcoidia bacterium]|nr:hypothetical protein [Dehalococcoidia bacterium]